MRTLSPAGTRPRRGTPAGAELVAILLLAAALVAATGPGSAPAAADGNEAPGAPVAARSIAAGVNHSCAIDSVGRLRCWGKNNRGQLGLGDIASRGDGANEMGLALPVVDLGTGRTATAISAGFEHTCALLDNGTVKCWGRSNVGQLGAPTTPLGDGPGEMGDALPTIDLGTGRTATAISAGFEHTCAVLDNGTVKCWGHNQSGQLGLGDVLTRGDQPGEMGDALPAVDLGTAHTAVAVSAGEVHTCALLEDATVKCWGDNGSGRLGVGDIEPRGDQGGEMGDTLPAVPLGTGRSATSVTAGGSSSCALLDDATVKCWGLGGNGVIGQGDATNRGDGPGELGDALPPVALGTGRTATALSAGMNGGTCVVLDDASLKCWGNNGNGQLGIGDTLSRGDGPGEMGDDLPAVDLGTGRTAVAVTTGDSHTCAVLDDATVRCWGINDSGQLGAGSTQTKGDGPNEMGDSLAIAALLGASVAGTVTSTLGGPVPGALVAALRTSDFSVAGGGAATSTGQYGFPVPAGSYYLYVIDPAGANEPRFLGAPTTVPVTTTTALADPVLSARRGAISGTLTETGSSDPVAGTYVLSLTTGGAFEGLTTTSAAGTYTLSGLTAGPHHVIFIDPTGGHGVRFHPSAPSFDTATPVSVVAGTTVTADGSLPAQTAVGRGAAITGRVTTTSSGTAVAGAVVLALRSNDLTFARATRTNGTGGYALDLAVGSYKVLFLDAAGRHFNEWYSDVDPASPGPATPVAAPGTANAVLDPTPLGDISGTVTTGGSLAAAAAWVVAVGPTGVAGGAVTAADGTYRISAVAPGNYRAAVVHPASGRYEYWVDGVGYEDGTVFQVLGGADVPLDADL